MKIRKKPYGTVNMVDANIEKLRKAQNFSQVEFITKLQALNLNMNPTSYSKLEGQLHSVIDKELHAKVLDVTIDTLFE